MKSYYKVLAVMALSGMCLAAPAPSDSDVAAQKTKKHHAEKTEEKAPCEVCEAIKQLKEQVAAQKEQVAAQQAEIDALKHAQPPVAGTTDAAAEAAAAAAQQQAAAAQQQAASAAAASAEASAKAAAAQSDVASLKTEVNTATAAMEHPTSVAYKGIRITPGGFTEATGYFRSHATLSDQVTQFQSIPLEHNANGTYANTESSYNPNLTETGFTPRDSRIAFRLDADPTKSAKLAAYYEMDFLGAASTANPNQTSSFTPRIRQAWGRVKFDNGWTITGGQMWSLITLNRKGTDADNSNLWIPNVIEAGYSVGYNYGRFGEIRVSKTFKNDFNFALELANASSLTQANNTTAGIAGVASTGNGFDANSLVNACTTSGTPPVTTCTNTPTYSTNLAPDMIVKLAYDSKFGHFEVKGISRFFRDRVLPTTTTAGWNNTDLGGGIGAGAVIPVVAKKIDFIAQGMYGKGISRYQAAGQYDFVIHSTPDRNLEPVKAFSALAGFETHPTRKTELDMLFGAEYYFRTLYVTNPSAVATGSAPVYGGYGAPAANNVACYFELNSLAPSGSACTGNNRVLWNGKIFAYYDLFKGPHGTLRYGAEYDYVYRGTWSGTGGLAAGAKGLAPKGIENTAFVTMRYILP